MIAAAFSVGVLTKALSELVTKVGRDATPSVTRKLKEWSTPRKLKRAADNLDKLRYVKTIWQIDKPVDLFDFYYPASLTIDGRAKRCRRLSDIPLSGNIVVEGVVGQGKSIFLRHLACMGAVDGEQFVAFVELRRFQTGMTIRSAAIAELTTLGFPCDDELFDYIARKGSLCLLLDAFDEVREENRATLIYELEQLSRAYPDLRIVVTSRPDSGVQHSPMFSIVGLTPLTADDHKGIISRICTDSATTDAILAGLETRAEVANVLTTPLMVALLVLRHRSDQTIPENYVAFFKDIFSLLLHRHDKSKAGYIRPRRALLNDHELEVCFCIASFVTRKEGATSYTRGKILSSFAEALSLQRLTADAADVVEDVRTTTCLLLEEGGEYRFIHKVVQEYHAAHFISLETEENATAFYMAMQTRWHAWEVELNFLESIDSHRCAKYFLMPMLRSILTDTGGSPIERLLDSLESTGPTIGMTTHLARFTMSRALERDYDGSLLGGLISAVEQIRTEIGDSWRTNLAALSLESSGSVLTSAARRLLDVLAADLTRLETDAERAAARRALISF